MPVSSGSPPCLSLVEYNERSRAIYRFVSRGTFVLNGSLLGPTRRETVLNSIANYASVHRVSRFRGTISAIRIRVLEFYGNILLVDVITTEFRSRGISRAWPQYPVTSTMTIRLANCKVSVSRKLREADKRSPTKKHQGTSNKNFNVSSITIVYRTKKREFSFYFSNLFPSLRFHRCSIEWHSPDWLC